jgi:para-nitrobenzyl esterase
MFGKDWKAHIERARRARPGATPFEMVTDTQTAQFVRGAQQLGATVAEGSGNAWFYRFAWSGPTSEFGACHCIDLPFVFGTFDAFKGAPMLSGGQRTKMEALSDVLRSALGRFVKNGSPDGENLPDWPRFSRSQPVEMVFDSLLRRDLVDLDNI